jgi:TraY domain
VVRNSSQRPSAKRRGRPSLPKGEGKRHAIGLRATADLRRKLEEGAKQSGRSLSQEAEFRLENSYRDDDRIAESFGGDLTFKIMRALAAIVLVMNSLRGEDWLSNPVVFDDVVNQWLLTLTKLGPKKFHPTGVGAGSVVALPDYIEIHGAAAAAGVLRQLADSLDAKDRNSLRATLREVIDRYESQR